MGSCRSGTWATSTGRAGCSWRGAATTWSESTLTWNSKPAAVGSALSTATVTGTTTPTGIKLALELPHTVYLLTRKQAAQDEVVLVKAGTSAEGGKKLITGEIDSHSTEFTRIQEVEVTSPAGKQVFPGFPLFPAQKRTFDFEWEQSGTPAQIVLKFQHFKIESSIAASVQ